MQQRHPALRDPRESDRDAQRALIPIAEIDWDQDVLEHTRLLGARSRLATGEPLLDARVESLRCASMAEGAGERRRPGAEERLGICVFPSHGDESYGSSIPDGGMGP